jgi:glycogen(starch) synthase
MRILFWPGTFWPVIGGIEVHAAKLLPALEARGYEFIVVTTHNSPDHPAEDTYNGIPVYRFRFWEGHNDVDRLMEIRGQINKLKREFAPDLVHRNGVGIGDFFHLITAKTYPTPLLVTLVNDLRHERIDNETSLRDILRQANWVNSVSEAALIQARQLVPEIASRSSVIHYGLDVPDNVPTPLPKEEPRLLCLGRLAPQKGFDVALTAFANIVERYPNARLVLAGDGPERSALEKQTAELGITDAVDFLGWVLPEDVPGLLNTATIVVMPSRWEGHPLVGLQATLMARPIVGTRVGGLPEIVEHNRTGLLVDREDSDALAAAIVKMLDDLDNAALLGENARSRSLQIFDWDACIDAYDNLYQQLTAGSRQGDAANTASPASPIQGA